jgi:cytochrome c oxidase subunit 3
MLGAFFLAAVAIGWHQLAAAGISLATTPGSSFFYVFTGTHALHVLAGIAVLLALAFRRPRHLAPVTVASVVSIYWHAINGLWVLLFLFLLAMK